MSNDNATLSPPIKLTIESDEKLLRKYGLATALYSTADYLLGEFIRLCGGLNNANQEVVNALLDDKSFGRRIELANKLIDDDALKAELKQGARDRNILAHGVSVDRGGEKFLMKKTEFHPLITTELDIMIGRARELNLHLLNEIRRRFRS